MRENRLFGFLGLAWLILAGLLFLPQEARAACEKPNVLFVLDKSGSMRGSRWNIVSSAVQRAALQNDHRLDFGLVYFDSRGYVAVPLPSRATAIQKSLLSTTPSGGTDFTSAMTAARNEVIRAIQADHRRNPPVYGRKYSIMFVTDGYGGSCPTTTVASLRNLVLNGHTYDIKTYAVGLTGANFSCLNKMAKAGGTTTSYYADIPASMDAAVDDMVKYTAQENCNGLDDDCDGLVDEDWPQKGSSCTVGVGECQRSGRYVCTANGSGVECSVRPGPPQKERCDGKDNDCDGRIDEDWPQLGSPCTAGIGTCRRTGKIICNSSHTGTECSVKAEPPRPEVCDDKDNDCDGLIDESWPDKGSPCEVGVGACKRRGKKICAPDGQRLVCSASPSSPQKEKCNGQDDDCDGKIDNNPGSSAPLNELCYTAHPATAGIGECKRGNHTCLAGKWGPCVGEVTPMQELCDGKDNDCNGKVDDKWPKKGLACSVGVGECKNTAKWVCSSDQWGIVCPAKAGRPTPELCDGKDNDCDGSVDENWPDKGSPCTAGVGACKQTGKKICAPHGKGTVCSAKAGTSQPEVCDGKDNDCDGSVDENWPQLGSPCSAGVGECKRRGKQVCAPGGQGTRCSVKAGPPSKEICDGKDNDCDGLIDNNAPGVKDPLQEKCYSGPAGTADKGLCQRGTHICLAGKWGPCKGEITPTKERCDGKDNDCDGRIDEDWPQLGTPCSKGQGECKRDATWTCRKDQSDAECPIRPGPPQKELCDGKDNDCDGSVDEDWPQLGTPCSVGVGQCQQKGKKVCAPHGKALECSVKPLPPQKELCDGKDNDCDGSVDEDWPQLGTPCSKGQGECKQAGKQICAPDGKGLTCDAKPGNPQKEVCDGKDNNCDGYIDNNTPGLQDPLQETCYSGPSGTAGVGLCQRGTHICLAGKWGPCKGEIPPAKELCDKKDNDCDGKVDEDFASDLGQTCTVGLGECERQGTKVCTADGKGVECSAQPGKPSPETCDGKDNDCDGQIDNQATCPRPGDVCIEGRCVPPSCVFDNECPGQEVCIDTKCHPEACYTSPCGGDKLCLKASCQTNSCLSKKCKEDEFCRPVTKACFPICPKCTTGERCKNGVCEPDPCINHNCTPNERCEEGKCIKDPCMGKEKVLCRHGRVCKPNGCHDDPCWGVRCAAGQQCIDGVCHETEFHPEPTEEPSREETVTEVVDGGESQSDDPAYLVGGGACSCSSGTPTAPTGALFLGLFLCALLCLRRRQK